MGPIGHSPRITVIYNNGIQDQIGPSLLPRLIDMKEIARFKRSDGWTSIGIDPIRGRGGPPYLGHNRRFN